MTRMRGGAGKEEAGAGNEWGGEGWREGLGKEEWSREVTWLLRGRGRRG